jgi:diacylglycerol kinase
MTTQKTSSRSSTAADRIDAGHHRKRPAWRQRLVQAERGFVRGIRADSVFFVHFFSICVVLAGALVLGIGWAEWIGITACLTLVLTAEMFNQALKAIAQDEDRPLTAAAQRAVSISTAAVMVASAGSCLVIVMVFWRRLQQMLG